MPGPRDVFEHGGQAGHGGLEGGRSWALANTPKGDLSDARQREIGKKLRTTDWDKVLKGHHMNTAELTSFRLRVAFVVGQLEAGKLHEINKTFNMDGY